MEDTRRGTCLVAGMAFGVVREEEDEREEAENGAEEEEEQ